MASVYEKRGVWYIRFKDALGRWTAEASRAKTKGEAKHLAFDRENDELRLRDVRLTLPQLDPSMSFEKLVNFWWKEYGSSLRSVTVKGSLEKHLLPALGNLTLSQVTGAQIEAVLKSKEGELAPATLNRLRGVVLRIFSVAIRRGLWNGANPVLMVPPFKVPKRLPEYLRAHEVPLLLDALFPPWRPLFATAIFTGLRQGELLGLRKTDVDRETGAIAVCRSYDADTTKGGRAALVPIAPELAPFIDEAIKSSPPDSELLFPAADGSMRARDTALDKVLRRALARAGLVLYVEHRCRARGCGHKERHPDDKLRTCPKCESRKGHRKLWPVPVPRHVRFHDLRHTTATLLLKAGVPLATVQRILRHSNPTITSEIYGHLDLEDLRRGVEKLSFGLPQKDSPPVKSDFTTERPAEPVLDPVCYPFATRAGFEGGTGRNDTPESPRDSGVWDGRPDWFRTNDLFRVKEALYH